MDKDFTPFGALIYEDYQRRDSRGRFAPRMKPIWYDIIPNWEPGILIVWNRSGTFTFGEVGDGSSDGIQGRQQGGSPAGS